MTYISFWPFFRYWAIQFFGAKDSSDVHDHGTGRGNGRPQRARCPARFSAGNRFFIVIIQNHHHHWTITIQNHHHQPTMAPWFSWCHGRYFGASVWDLLINLWQASAMYDGSSWESINLMSLNIAVGILVCLIMNYFMNNSEWPTPQVTRTTLEKCKMGRTWFPIFAINSSKSSTWAFPLRSWHLGGVRKPSTVVNLDPPLHGLRGQALSLSRSDPWGVEQLE